MLLRIVLFFLTFSYYSGARDYINCDKKHGKCSRGPNFRFKNKRISPNAGFYAFDFKKAGLQVDTAFYYHSDRNTTFIIFDCFCSGDGFLIFDKGLYLGSIGIPNASATCEYFSSDPVVCSANLLTGPVHWPIGIGSFTPGVHNITITPFVTPYGEGTAFFRVDDGCLPSPNSIYQLPCCRSDNSCELNTVN